MVKQPLSAAIVLAVARAAAPSLDESSGLCASSLLATSWQKEGSHHGHHRDHQVGPAQTEGSHHGHHRRSPRQWASQEEQGAKYASHAHENEWRWDQLPHSGHQAQAFPHDGKQRHSAEPWGPGHNQMGSHGEVHGGKQRHGAEQWGPDHGQVVNHGEAHGGKQRHSADSWGPGHDQMGSHGEAHGGKQRHSAEQGGPGLDQMGSHGEAHGGKQRHSAEQWGTGHSQTGNHGGRQRNSANSWGHGDNQMGDHFTAPHSAEQRGHGHSQMGSHSEAHGGRQQHSAEWGPGHSQMDNHGEAYGGKQRHSAEQWQPGRDQMSGHGEDRRWELGHDKMVKGGDGRPWGLGHDKMSNYGKEGLVADLEKPGSRKEFPKGWNTVADEKLVPGKMKVEKEREDAATKKKSEPKEGKTDPQEQGDTCAAKDVHIIPYAQQQLWGYSFRGWEACGGERQSPIDLTSTPQTRFVRSDPLRWEYFDHSPKRLVNNGKALGVQGTLLKGLYYQGQKYLSQQVHFHHPSEHTVDGKAAPMEMHVITEAEDGQKLVVALLFEIGASNRCVGLLAEPLKAGCSRPIEHFGLHCFDDQLKGSYWSYEGSLTTPPCTENVHWIVMRSRASMSMLQLMDYKKMFVENSRYVQPLFQREVTAHVVEGPAVTLKL